MLFLLRKILYQSILVFSVICIVAILNVKPAYGINESNPAQEKIIVTGEINYPPYSFIDKSGKPTGFSIELTRSIAKIMGMNIEINLTDWSIARRALDEGKAEIIPGMFYSEERAKTHVFSPPFCIINSAIFARKNSSRIKSLEDLHNKEIIVMRGEVMHDFIIEHRLTDRLLLAESPSDALRMLSSGKGDYAIVAQMPGLYWIMELKLSNLESVGPILQPFKNCFVAKKGNELLLSRFIEGLNILKQTGDYQRLYEKWLGILEPNRVTLGLIFKYASFVVVPLLLILFLSFFWTLMLRSKVNQKTRELKESESMLRQILDTVPQGIFWKNKDGAYMGCNNAFAKAVGLDNPEKIIGKTDFEMPWPMKEAEAYRADDAEVISTGKSKMHICEPMQQADGVRLLIDTSKMPLLDNNEQIRGVLGIFEDITERKRAADELRESEEKYRLIAENMSDVISLMDMNLRFTYVSPSINRLTGFSVEEALKHSIEEIMTPDSFKEILKIIEEEIPTETTEKLDPGRTRIIEYEQYRKDKSIVWVESNCRFMFDQDQKLKGILIISRDITERKKAEIALRKSEENYRKLVTTTPYGIQLTDLEGKIIFSNSAHHKIQGYKDGELVGKYIWDLMIDDTHKDKAREHYQRIIKEVPIPKVYYNRDKTKDGREIEVQIDWDYIYDSEGKIEGIISIVSDITERRRLEDKLRQAQKIESIGNLAGGIAHDFNNILSPIIGMSEMLIEDLPSDTPEQENAGEIFRAGIRGRELVKQILAFSRQSEHKMIPTHVQHILKEVLKLTKSTIPTNIQINQDIQSNCGMVMADPTQIHQVAMNTITNAYHAIEGVESGTINVQLKEVELTKNNPSKIGIEPGRYVVLSISDNGHGMTADIIDKIFDPYFTTKEQGRGTGLGLAVVHGIVQEHKGTINVYSEVGKGTTFDIYFPLMDKPVITENLDKNEQNLTGSERILLVDDEAAIAKLEKLMLERLGYHVTSRLNSIEALEAFKAQKDDFDLVITDMSMPHMTGDQLAKELISIQPDIPVIICTGFSEKMDEEKAKEIGVKGLLMKPVVKAELTKMIRKVLDENKS